MGKKSRRKAKLRAAARMAQGMPAQAPYRPQPTAAQITTHKPVQPSIQQTSLPVKANQYGYVGPELRQIAIIAGALFVILFILAFFLH